MDAKTHQLGHVGVAITAGLVTVVMIYAVCLRLRAVYQDRPVLPGRTTHPLEAVHDSARRERTPQTQMNSKYKSRTVFKTANVNATGTIASPKADSVRPKNSKRNGRSRSSSSDPGNFHTRR